MKFFNTEERITFVFFLVISFCLFMGISEVKGQDIDVKLHTETWWVGGLTNNSGEYSYWVVEWTGLDAEGDH
jgi:hypothetical protein